MLINRPVIRGVIEQHASELQAIWSARHVLAQSGHTALKHLSRFDVRLSAHLDACVVTGAQAVAAVLAGLANPSAGAMYAAAAVLLEVGDQSAFDQLLRTTEAIPQTFSGLVSALGWVPPERLAGVVRLLLISESPYRRRIGLASCRVHGVHPNATLLDALRDANPAVRAEAIRGIGSMGSVDLLPQSSQGIRDEDPACAFWASWSAVMLGDRSAVPRLAALAISAGPCRTRAFRLALQAAKPDEAHELLQQQVASDINKRRRTIAGSGIIGHTKYVPWLIDHMSEDALARSAGEAFSLITGVDLAALKLERRPPEDFESGPNDDPDDPNVDMDPDDGLPWPDVKKVEAWWHANEHRFQAGTRYFMGQLLTKEHCINVLKTGYQRQRILAAHYLCLLEPGTPLFNTSAPAWRQQRLLAGM